MRSLKICLLSALATVNAAGAGDVDYTENGRNWDGGCKGSNQSPIDLKRDAAGVDPSREHLQKLYQDLGTRTVKWMPAVSTTQVTVDSNAGSKSTPPTAYFRSKFGREVFGTPAEFQAAQFHFHSGSEHTIDGKQYDLEMHTVHFPKSGSPKTKYVAAALGIIFDVDDYDKDVTADQVAAIDNFFASLALGRNDPSVSYVSYGQLVTALDTEQRWVYQGSVTTPPCATTVYWNVLNKVYPVKKAHLNAYRAQLKRNTKQNIQKTGNFREAIEPKAEHQLRLIADEHRAAPEEPTDYRTATAVLAVLCALVLIGLMIIACCFAKLGKNSEQSYDAAQDTERARTETEMTDVKK